jgi:hypothetical protein
MRLPRMTTRRWMVAVAIVALGFGGSIGAVRMKRLRDSYFALAMHHASLARALKAQASAPARLARLEPDPESMTTGEIAGATDSMSAFATDRWDRYAESTRYREYQQARERAIADARRIVTENWRRVLERLRKRVDYHAALARKYRRAASYPWLPIEPDPPKPQ